MFHPFINSIVSDKKKQALSNMSFYQQNTISLYNWILLVLSCNIFLMTFHGSIFLNIKLGPFTTSSPRRRGRGLHNPDSSHDQIRCFWLAEVRNFTNIMIECEFWSTGYYRYRKTDPEIIKEITELLTHWPVPNIFCLIASCQYGCRLLGACLAAEHQ